jgi:hypothetical protein
MTAPQKCARTILTLRISENGWPIMKLIFGLRSVGGIGRTEQSSEPQESDENLTLRNDVELRGGAAFLPWTREEFAIDSPCVVNRCRVDAALFPRTSFGPCSGSTECGSDFASPGSV